MGDVSFHYAGRALAWYVGLALAAIAAAGFVQSGGRFSGFPVPALDYDTLRASLIFAVALLGITLRVVAGSTIGLLTGLSFLAVLGFEALVTLPSLRFLHASSGVRAGLDLLPMAASVAVMGALFSFLSERARVKGRAMLGAVALLHFALGVLIVFCIQTMVSAARPGLWSSVLALGLAVPPGVVGLFIVRRFAVHPSGLVAGLAVFLLLGALSAAGHWVPAPWIRATSAPANLSVWAMAAIPFGFLVDALQALARVRLYSGTLADASLRDPLTGLFNRRALGASASVVFSDCMRAGQPVSVLMLDIDHFKMVNDLHGHPAGDSVLHQFAELLLASARTSDTTARYGGEEFVVVLPGSPLAPALRLAERIRETTENTIFTHGKLKLNLTVSVGAATAFPGEMASFDALLENADRNLYRAKREGRNRVLANPIIAEAETD